MAIGEPELKRWTREEFYRLGEAGILAGRRAELIEGDIYMMSPQGPRHAAVIMLLQEALRDVLPDGCSIRVQSPLALDMNSEPEPDVAVVAGRPDDYLDRHPDSALLVIEVSESTLAFDRDDKQSLYARFGIQEFWIVDLVNRRVEVRRIPSDSGYQDLQVLGSESFLVPLFATHSQIAINSILR